MTSHRVWRSLIVLTIATTLVCAIFTLFVNGVLSKEYNEVHLEERMDFPIKLSASTIKVLYQNTSSKLEELGLTRNGKIVSEEAAVRIFGTEGAGHSGDDFSVVLASILANEDSEPYR